MTEYLGDLGGYFDAIARLQQVIEAGDQASVQVGRRVFLAAPHRQIAAMHKSRVIGVPDAIPDDEAVFLSILEVAHRAIRQVLFVGQRHR